MKAYIRTKEEIMTTKFLSVSLSLSPFFFSFPFPFSPLFFFFLAEEGGPSLLGLTPGSAPGGGY